MPSRRFCKERQRASAALSILLRQCCQAVSQPAYRLTEITRNKSPTIRGTASYSSKPTTLAQFLHILGDLVGLITKHLKKGERIKISGLGILQVRKRAARMGRNPATGEAIKIKASKKVAFRAAKDLKMAV